MLERSERAGDGGRFKYPCAALRMVVGLLRVFLGRVPGGVNYSRIMQTLLDNLHI